MRTIHISDQAGRSARVLFEPLTKPKPSVVTKDGRALTTRTFFASDGATHDDADFSLALIEGDPEINMEVVGKEVGPTQRVYLTDGDVMPCPPSFIEVVSDKDGKELYRRPATDRPANVNVSRPVTWGQRLPIAEAVRRYVFAKTLQLRHKDGLTYDYLFSMAEDLEKTQEMVYLGAGKGALRFTANGTPHRGFLEGRTNGKEYKLLLHLTNMEQHTTGEGS